MIKKQPQEQVPAEPHMQFCRLILAAASLLGCVACGPSSELDRAQQGPLQGRFYLSDHFAASGHMGDGEQPGFITADIDENCHAERPEDGPTARPANAGGDCYRFTYQPDVRPGAEMWAGVYWVYPANNWGTRPGRVLVPPYKRVRFQAPARPRGFDESNPELPPEPRVSFIVGGIGTNPNDPQPYGDETVFMQQAFKNARLSNVWQPFEIDLTGIIPDNPFHMISGFCWTVNYQPGVPTAKSSPTVIYIDDIVWDTE